MTNPKTAPTVDLGGTAQAHAGVLTPELVPVDQVRPHPKNPRVGDVDVIDKSLTQHDLYRPILAQRSSGHILAGNHTYKALAGRGATQVPVTWLDVDDAEAARIMADDNHAADFGVYDDRVLLDLLDSLAGTELPATYAGDDELLELLTRRVEAEDVFTVGTGHMIDEFRGLGGMAEDEDGRYDRGGYVAKVAIYFRDDAALDDFRQRLGITDSFASSLDHGGLTFEQWKRYRPATEREAS